MLFATGLSHAIKYASLGGAFGCLSPLTASAIEAVSKTGTVTLLSLLEAEQNEPFLLGMINTAPVFPGAFAWAAGRRQD